MKYYEILPTHTETPRNTTRKISNLYIEFNYHFLTLQKNPITFEQECTSNYEWMFIYMTQFNMKMRPTSIRIPFVEIRPSYDRLISTMGINILVRHDIESGTRTRVSVYSPYDEILV